MKFKVGDKVIALPSADCEGYNGANTSMLEGEIVGIKDRGLDGEPMILVKIIHHEYLQYRGQTYFVKAKHFKLIESPQSIHITQDEDTVHAVLKDGREVVKRSKAVCSPRDEFDFATGARIAFDRLFEETQWEPLKKVEEVTEDSTSRNPPTKKGDIIQVGDDIPIDTLVEVWDTGSQREIRRFAGFVPKGRNGNFLAFGQGESSKSLMPTNCWWINAALAEDLPSTEAPEAPTGKRYFSLKKYMKWRERTGKCLELTPKDGGWALECDGQEVIGGFVTGTNRVRYSSSPIWETTKPPKEKLYFDKDLFIRDVYGGEAISTSHWSFECHGKRVKNNKVKRKGTNPKLCVLPKWCTTTKPGKKGL